MIYLDNAATTKTDKNVIEEMLSCYDAGYGNAGAKYRFGREALLKLKAARAYVALFFGCETDNIVFTSGGSESNTMVFRGLQKRLEHSGLTHIVISATEHESVKRAAHWLAEANDSYVTEVLPRKDGCVYPEDVENAITEDTGLVSVMYVNNETGARNDVAEIGKICRRHGVLFHTDCVQAAGTVFIDVDYIGCDFASISAHKIHGPKGCGALYVRDINLLEPTIFGGSDQERGLRGGTENVPGIVGFGVACENATKALENGEDVRVLFTKVVFYDTLVKELEKMTGDSNIVSVNGPDIHENGKILNIHIKNVDSETLILMLDNDGVCVSAGSACRSHESEPSYVLTSMGISPEDARESIRVSFSKCNNELEARAAATIVAKNIATLLSM